MENQDLSDLFNKINHISLNYDDLLAYFTQYLAQNRERLFANYKAFTYPALEAFMNYPEFLESAVLSARQSVVLAMLALTLEAKFEEEQFNQLCLNCNCQAPKDYYINETLVEIEKILQKPADSLPFLQLDYVMIAQECRHFFSNFEKETFSKLLSKNKDTLSYTGLTSAIIDKRKELFFNLVDNRI